MVPLQKNIKPISTLLHHINPSTLSVPELQRDKNFLKFLEASLQTNEVKAIQFQQVDNLLYCFPIIQKEAFTTTVHRILWNKTLSGVVGKFQKSTASMDFKLRKYWTLQDFIELEQLEKLDNPKLILQKALIVAKRVLRRSPKNLGVVCGPISTGTKSVKENLRIFNRTMYKISQTMNVFNQLPFESLFARVHELLKKPEYVHLMVEGSSSLFFMRNFYDAVFAVNKNWKPHFIHGWKHSTGAKDEHRIFTLLNSPIVYLKKGFDVL